MTAFSELGEQRGVVEVEYRGRLGNQLFGYCVARVLAEALDFGLLAPPIDGFPRASPLGVHCPHALAALPCENVVTAHELDLPALTANRHPRRLRINGFFLRYDYIRSHREIIRDHWLQLEPAPGGHPDDLTIHVRTGDLWVTDPHEPRPSTEYHSQPFSFYEGIIQSRRWRKVHVVCGDPTDLMVQKLAASFDAKVRSDDIMDDFNFIRGSQNTVLSVSTFAWWAAWLSTAQRIYFPVAGLYDEERASRRPHPWQQKLVVREERYIPVVPRRSAGAWLGTVAQRHLLLDS